MALSDYVAPVLDVVSRQWNRILDGRLQDQRNRSVELGAREVHLSPDNMKNNTHIGHVMGAKMTDYFRLYYNNFNGFRLDAEGGDFREFCYLA